MKDIQAIIAEIEVLIRQLSSKLVFTQANMKNHCNNVPYRNFVVKLVHFELKQRKNNRNRGFN
jgi:hypothetical protein